MGKEKLKIGDNVLIEQCWEDTNGCYHDEYLTVARILSDGRLKFRIGHWKTRKQKDQLKQAWINKFEWYPENCEKVE